jgi:hypothetical protein
VNESEKILLKKVINRPKIRLRGGDPLDKAPRAVRKAMFLLLADSDFEAKARTADRIFGGYALIWHEVST